MRREFICLLSFFTGLLFIVSCNSGSKYDQDVVGFEMIQNDLKKMFGEEAYYTDISITNSPGKGVGSGINLHLTVTNDPQSLKMQEWIYNSQTDWKNTADIKLEIPKGDNAINFMYQLNGDFDLKRIGELVENSVKKIASEKDIDNAVLDMVLLKTPDNTDVSGTTIYIRMKSEDGGTSFNFRYALTGELLSFDY